MKELISRKKIGNFRERFLALQSCLLTTLLMLRIADGGRFFQDIQGTTWGKREQLPYLRLPLSHHNL
jgi:hypothetical protein